MTASYVLGVIALAQGVFMILLLGFLVVRRHEMRRRREAFASRRDSVMSALRAWLAGEGSVTAFVESLRGMPRVATLAYTSHLAASLVPVNARNELAHALREETWIRRMLGGARDVNWWHRREAARALSLAGHEGDRLTLMRLLLDPQPAVAIAAISALPRVADAEVVALVLDRYPHLPEVVRHYLRSTLRDLRHEVEPLLLERLVPDAPPAALAHWLALAGVLELNSGIERAESLVAHPAAEVRQAAARTLGRLPRERTVNVLRLLLADPDASVRASAARALGLIGSAVARPPLERALQDPAFDVRYHAALALALLGDAGRGVLLARRTDSDRYVADITTLISGLTEGALLELAAD